MSRTLSEIISGALGEADQEIKLASARDALPVDLDLTPDNLVRMALDEAKSSPSASLGGSEKTASAAPVATPKDKLASRDVVSTADYAIKLAEALDHAATILTAKLAAPAERAETSTPMPGGLPAMASGHMEPTKDTNTKAQTLSAHEAFTGGDGGSAPTIETFKSPHAESGKTAAVEAAARQAQARVVKEASLASTRVVVKKAEDDGYPVVPEYAALPAHVRARPEAGGVLGAIGGSLAGAATGAAAMHGVRKATKGLGPMVAVPAQVLTGLVGALGTGAAAIGGGVLGQRAGRQLMPSEARSAYDRQMDSDMAHEEATMHGKHASNDPGGLPIDPPVASGPVPDNMGAIAMTQRDAKSREKAEIAKHVDEPAFSATSDAGLKDNTEHAAQAGAKIASEQEKAMRALLAKIASKKNDPNATPEDLAKVARLEKAIAQTKTASQKTPSALLG